MNLLNAFLNKIVQSNVEISAFNVSNATMKPVDEFKTERIKLKDSSKFMHKTYGKMVFYVEKKFGEPSILMPEIAMAYNNVCLRKNLLIVFCKDKKTNKISFLFIDTRNIFNKDSFLKIDFNQDQYYDQNILQIKEYIKFFSDTNREIDLLCTQEDMRSLKEIPPFNDVNFFSKLYIVPIKDLQKIILSLKPLTDGMFIFKKNIIASLIIILPFISFFICFDSLKESKRDTLRNELSSIEDRATQQYNELEALKKNDFYINNEHYKRLKEKKVLQ